SKANAGVTFKVEYIPNNEMPQKYQGALATGSAPDILALDTEWPAVYAALGALADPPAEMQTAIKNNAFPTVQEVTTYKGKFVAEAQSYPDWVFDKKINDVTGIEDAFTHGKAGLTLAGPWTITSMKADAPDVEWKSWLVPPQKAGGQSGTTLGGWHLGAYSK